MKTLFRLDAAQLIRDRLAVMVLAIAAIACLLAVFSGNARIERLHADVAAFQQIASSEQAKAREAWAAASGGDPAETVLLPMRVSLPVVLNLPTLPDFTTGRSELEPTATNVRLSTRPDAVFARYQVENPERLARGGIDLGFFAVALAPLLLIGLGYGVFVGDRDAGTARLWLAQAGSPLRLILVRSLNRLALVLVPLALAAIALLLMGPAEAGRVEAATVWFGIALLGLLFWWAVILIVNTLPVSAETAALALVAGWVVLVFVVPVATVSLATLLDPPPSRFEQITAARAAEVGASRDFDDDHPDFSSTTLEGRRTSLDKGIGVRAAVAASLAPLKRDYDARVGTQRRTVEALAVLSPPLLTANALSAVSGTDVAAYARQKQAVAAYLVPLGGSLIASARGERPIDAATFDALPRFSAPSPARPAFGSALLLALITFGLFASAFFRLRRARPA